MKVGSMKGAFLGYQLHICRLHQLKNRFISELLLVSEMLASLHPLEQLQGLCNHSLSKNKLEQNIHSLF